jgi:hypothetical protein
MGHPDEVDVIIAGGGPAGSHAHPCLLYCIQLVHTDALGCVVAGRLAYADPNLKVMLIEGLTPLNLIATTTRYLCVYLARWSKQPR